MTNSNTICTSHMNLLISVLPDQALYALSAKISPFLFPQDLPPVSGFAAFYFFHLYTLGGWAWKLQIILWYNLFHVPLLTFSGKYPINGNFHFYLQVTIKHSMFLVFLSDCFCLSTSLIKSEVVFFHFHFIQMYKICPCIWQTYFWGLQCAKH